MIVGLDNYARTFTDPPIAGPLLGIAAWNFGFAILTVVLTFAAGLLVAITLNSPRVRGLRFYRVLIVLPYAMPSFAMLLVWRDMFNADFGLINNLTGRAHQLVRERLDGTFRHPPDPVLARLPVHVPRLASARSSPSRRT